MRDPEENLPKNLEQSIDFVLSELSDEDKIAIAELDEDDIAMLHFGLGLWIRNVLKLWIDNPELCKAITGNADAHPDDVSSEILIAVRNKLREER